EAVPVPPSGIDVADIERALASFRGTFDQAPPPFSAKKIGGVPAYTLARKSKPVQPTPVSVTVHDLAIDRYADGVAVVRVRASAGFYVRSLAHDLGRMLGCGAHLETLRRARAAALGEDVAVPLSRSDGEGHEAAPWIVPLDRWPTATAAG